MQNAIHDILLGNEFQNSNPVHPALVHLPLVLIPLSVLLRWAGTWPTLGNWGVDRRNTLTIAHWITLLALVCAIPVAITGLAEYKHLTSQQGDPCSQEPLNLARTHGVLNSIVLLMTGWIAYSTWKSQQIGYQPTIAHLWVGLFSVILLVVSGHLGGKMVYEHGIGVQRQGKGLYRRAFCQP